MASEKDFELLDDYISNRLPMDERVAFEQQLASDPALASAYELQNKIAESIKKARAAELKKMLNNIPVPPASGNSMLIKIAAIILTTGLIGTGVYYYFNADDEPAEETIELSETETTADSSTEQPQEEPAAEESVENEEHQTVISPDKQRRKRTDVSGSPESAKRSLDVFDPSDETEVEGVTELAEESVSIRTSPALNVETDNTHKKYDFHYQFANGKLYLYGSFDKNLYEIMEFISENKRTVFLYYKNNYYLLNDGSDKVKALNPVNDPALLKKLREHRINQN